MTGKAGSKFSRSFTPFFFSSALGECYYFLDSLVDINRYHLSPSLTQEHSDPRDNLCRPSPVAENPHHGLASFLEIRRHIVKPPQTSVTVGHHTGEQLIQFLCDGSKAEKASVIGYSG
jgi:hypothetical protein